MKYSALTLLLAAGALAAESDLPDFLPPATNIMFGVQVRRILDSSLSREVTPDAAAGALAGVGRMGAEWRKIVSLAGFDPFQDVDEVLIACAADADHQQQDRNPPMLLIARGRFNVERFSANASLYHDVPVLKANPSSTGTIALLDESTAIMGEVAEVHAAIDRRASGTTIDAALRSSVESLRMRYDVWGLGDIPANLVPQSSLSDGLDSIDHFQAGVSITHGLKIAAEVHARTDKDAEKLTQSMQLLEVMMKSQPAARSAKLDIHEDHGTIKLALAISEAELKRAMEAQRVAHSLRPAAAPVNSTAPFARRGPAPLPQTSPLTLPQTGPGNGDTIVFTLPGKRL